MDIKNTLIAIVVSAIISSICTATILMANKPMIISSSIPPTASDLNSIKSQLEQVKAELARETQARISLAQQLNELGGESAPYSGSGSQSLDQDSQDQSRKQYLEQRQTDRLESQQLAYRQQHLIDSGFSREETARIFQIESEEAYRRLQVQYDRRRENAASTNGQYSNINPIRAELGEENYQRYLETNGWPTSVLIGSVIGGSPGESAGLRAGDNVLSYAGERVFNINEINNLTIQGQVGESILIEVERNGDLLQLTIPRGPIGINAGNRSRR